MRVSSDVLLASFLRGQYSHDSRRQEDDDHNRSPAVRHDHVSAEIFVQSEDHHGCDCRDESEDAGRSAQNHSEGDQRGEDHSDQIHERPAGLGGVRQRHDLVFDLFNLGEIGRYDLRIRIPGFRSFNSKRFPFFQLDF